MIDILIIGAGGAGLSAALKAKEEGMRVTVVCEGYPTRSQTCMAQGGINAALGNVSEDSISSHKSDTLKASASLASPHMVKTLCEDAPKSVAWLDSIGVPFSRTDKGKIAQRKLGGASGVRACYSQDYTGLKILHTLFDQALKEEITFVNERFLLNFSVEKNRIHGATFYNIRNGEVEFIEAKSVIVATGGYSALYHGFTTNTNQSTGDGIAAALRAGAKISNMEFIQFHPTALKDSSVLISESARGAGGKLRNTKGERFVDELKPRDVVSRAIWEEIQKGEDVFLDIRHLGEAFIDENIPQERKLCKMYANVDPVTDLIPIAPVAHYSMGGIAVDENHMSGIAGLFAIGECANAKVHGANRLGGNSLLEIISFGRKAGEHASKFANKCGEKESTEQKQLDLDQKLLNDIKEIESEVDFYEKRAFLGTLFYNHVGILREEASLKKALLELSKVRHNVALMGVFDKGSVYNTNLLELLKFRNILELGEVTVMGALARCESRGAHFRIDFPMTSLDFQKESVI